MWQFLRLLARQLLQRSPIQLIVASGQRLPRDVNECRLINCIETCADLQSVNYRGNNAYLGVFMDYSNQINLFAQTKSTRFMVMPVEQNKKANALNVILYHIQND